ncbi:MBL fold metallo-hydrolase [Tumebacillus sp. ITR2]|uniref:MBL fold metallo-hydrolase n=1 Tax=Tumebacillus amylolyticus TaxID=2801339 RepID=A0ABS1J9G1_9BACL|nr:MBL fold metallo-hydrolase [Tumebacillus amylolyticus]MBL0386917.1 MBL fold metallo-hydrolase [Tumebacillus amylolyticus]
MSTTIFSSPYFQLQEVAHGVYAAIMVRGTGASSNAAIVDLGDRTLVFDTFYTPQAAADLRRAAEQLLQRPVSLVVNSHGHFDHVFGNQVFTDGEIIATVDTREFMAVRSAALIEYAKSNPEYLDQFAQEIEQETDPANRAQMQDRLSDMRVFDAALPTLEPRLPTLLFEHELTFHGKNRTATLITYGGGHTPSDAFLYLPDEKLALMGDLLTVQTHNQFMHGDVHEFVQNLKRIEELPIDIAVPGHGPVGSMEDIRTMRLYFEELLQRSDELHAQGVSPEEAADLPIPDKYVAWDVPSLYGVNLHQLLQQKATAAGQS